MKLGKLMIGFFIILITALHVKAKNMESIPVTYINFNQISLNNLFGFLGKEYHVNFSIEPEFRQNKVSIHLQNTNLRVLLDIITTENGLAYRVENNVIYIAPLKQNLTKKFRTGDFKREKIVLNYASLKDVLQFLQDVMPAQVLLRSSTENKPYSNLFNATPDLAIPSEVKEDTSTKTVYPKLEEDKQSLSATKDGGTIDKNIPTDILHVIPFYNTNTIYLLSTSKKLLNEAIDLIQEIDQPLKQVLIQGQIMEFTVGDGFNSIFELETLGSNLKYDENYVSNAVLGNFKYSFLDAKLIANIDIAKREGRASFVSSPLLLTMNRTSSTLDLTEGDR